MSIIDQKTLVIVKPDGVERRLIGEVISRFEKVGLKVVSLKMTQVDAEFVGRHYADDPVWYKSVGDKLVQFCQEYKMDCKAEMGTDDPIELGKKVREWLFTYLTSGPVVPMVLQGPHAVETVRKLVGATYPLNATPGTIRGDLAIDSPYMANSGKRSVLNIVHASGTEEEATREIALWFGQE